MKLLLLIPPPAVPSASLQPLPITYADEASPIVQGQVTPGHTPGTWVLVPALLVTHHVIEGKLLGLSGY